MADITVTVENLPPPTISVDSPITLNGLTVGTIETGEPGTEVVATITGAPPNQKLNLTIPRGDTGEKGDEGDEGPAGPTVPDDGSVTPAKLANPLDLSGKTLTLPTGLILPVGGVLWHSANTAPSGYLKANGAAISRAAYAELFAVIGTTYGAGDGSTTFNLPDLRGEFVRGWDDGRGVDSGRTFASAQGHQFQNHFHTVDTKSSTANLSPGSGLSNIWNGTTTLSPGASSGNRGDETRPRNVALLACIRYA